MQHFVRGELASAVICRLSVKRSGTDIATYFSEFPFPEIGRKRMKNSILKTSLSAGLLLGMFSGLTPNCQAQNDAAAGVDAAHKLEERFPCPSSTPLDRQAVRRWRRGFSNAEQRVMRAFFTADVLTGLNFLDSFKAEMDQFYLACSSAIPTPTPRPPRGDHHGEPRPTPTARPSSEPSPRPSPEPSHSESPHPSPEPSHSESPQPSPSPHATETHRQ